MKNRIRFLGVFIILVLLFDMRQDAVLPVANLAFLILLFLSLPHYKYLKMCTPHFCYIAFTLYNFVSLIWSPDINYSITRSITVALLFLLFSTIVIYYRGGFKTLNTLLVFFMVGSLLLLILMCVETGSFSLEALKSSERLDSQDFMDSNLIAKIIALGSAIHTFLYLNLYKKKWFLFLAIIFLFGVLLTKSKGAMISYIVGNICVLYFHYKNINNISSFYKLLFAGAVVIGALLSSGIFGDAFIRLTGMFDFISSNDANDDYSTFERLDLINTGWDYFTKKPLLGYGIGSSNYLLKGNYFHNNYIQLLVEVGIVGFLLFYSIYYYIIKTLWTYRNNSYSTLMLSMLIVQLFSDINNATYYSKLNCILLGISFMTVQIVKSQIKVENYERTKNHC